MSALALWLDIAARVVIEQEARHRRLRETGGPLFGYQAESGATVVIRALGPGPNSHHHRLRFVPNPQDTQDAIDRVFRDSEGRHSYLGDWHTHPGGAANLSGRDLESLADIAGDPEVDQPQPIALIQATTVLRPRVGLGQLAAVRWNKTDQLPEALAIRMANQEAGA